MSNHTSTEVKLSATQSGMLAWIVRENRPVRIANERTVNALLRRGLIELAPNPVNYGRPVQATDAGRAVAATL